MSLFYERYEALLAGSHPVTGDDFVELCGRIVVLCKEFGFEHRPERPW